LTAAGAELLIRQPDAAVFHSAFRLLDESLLPQGLQVNTDTVRRANAHCGGYLADRGRLPVSQRQAVDCVECFGLAGSECYIHS
jgi:hypothetical protein